MNQPELFELIERNKLLADLFQAYYDARKNKRNTHSALSFEMRYERGLFRLCDEILNRSYSPRPSICFIVNKPVKREVFAADFRDRIVHHLIYNYIAHIFENRFIHDSYSCRIGKGTHYGIKRVDHFIRSCSQNYHNDCYILKTDIKGYFMSIDRSILYEKIKSRIISSTAEIQGDISLILSLIRKTLFNDSVNGCIMRCSLSEWKGLPHSKSLFHVPKNKGLPIGNLTSQLFANIYLDAFDQYMKRDLKLEYYGRYVDDMVIVHKERNYLKSVIPEIKQYLSAKLMLELHPRKIYLQHYSKGVQFLGAVIKPYRIYVANRTKGNFYNAIKRQNEIVKYHEPTKEERGNLLSSLNSYLGIMKHYNTYKLRKDMVFRLLSSQWWNYVYMSGGFNKFILRQKFNRMQPPPFPRKQQSGSDWYRRR